MKRWRLWSSGLIICVLVIPMPLSAAFFEMNNEDVVIGELSGQVKIELAFGSFLEVPPQEVMSIEGDRFALQDGTKVTGRIAQETLFVKNKYAMWKLRVAQIKRIRFERKPAAIIRTGGAWSEMMNGDLVVGELIGQLKIALVLGGQWETPAKEVVSIEGNRFVLQDGTSVIGRIRQETLWIRSRYGTVNLPVAELKSIRLEGKAPAGR